MADRRARRKRGIASPRAGLAAWPAFGPDCACRRGWRAFRAALDHASREDLTGAGPLLRAAGRQPSRASARPCIWSAAGCCCGRATRRVPRRELAAGLRITPAAPLLQVSLGHALMLLGRYREGWEALEARRRLDFGGKSWFPALPGPEWQGEEFAGTLLVHAEQGMGDCIMLARYLPADRAPGRAGRARLPSPAGALAGDGAGGGRGAADGGS